MDFFQRIIPGLLESGVFFIPIAAGGKLAGTVVLIYF
jgi:hypothetical protein